MGVFILWIRARIYQTPTNRNLERIMTSLIAQICDALVSIGPWRGESGGITRSAIANYICEKHGKRNTFKFRSDLQRALRKGVDANVLEQGKTCHRFMLAKSAPSTKPESSRRAKKSTESLKEQTKRIKSLIKARSDALDALKEKQKREMEVLQQDSLNELDELKKRVIAKSEATLFCWECFDEIEIDGDNPERFKCTACGTGLCWRCNGGDDYYERHNQCNWRDGGYLSNRRPCESWYCKKCAPQNLEECCGKNYCWKAGADMYPHGYQSYCYYRHEVRDCPEYQWHKEQLEGSGLR